MNLLSPRKLAGRVFVDPISIVRSRIDGSDYIISIVDLLAIPDSLSSIDVFESFLGNSISVILRSFKSKNIL